MRAQKTNEFSLILGSHLTTRPTTSFGASIVPTQNTTGGAYTTLMAGAAVTEDVYGIEININTTFITATARDCIATLALDPAGGTSYTDVVDLLCGSAGTYVTGGGMFFYFPLWIKAGTSIGMRGSVSTVDVTAFNASCRLQCRPSRPELIWCGQKIESLGLTIASSTGTAITMGTTAEGLFTLIGAPTRNTRYVEWGFSANDAGLNLSAMHLDIGVGTTQRIIAQDRLVTCDTNERCSKYLSAPIWTDIKAGENMYIRMQCQGVVETISTALYCMGG